MARSRRHAMRAKGNDTSLQPQLQAVTVAIRDGPHYGIWTLGPRSCFNTHGHRLMRATMAMTRGIGRLAWSSDRPCDGSSDGRGPRPVPSSPRPPVRRPDRLRGGSVCDRRAGGRGGLAEAGTDLISAAYAAARYTRPRCRRSLGRCEHLPLHFLSHLCGGLSGAAPPPMRRLVWRSPSAYAAAPASVR